MDYQAAMAFLEDTKKYGSVPGLDSIRALMQRLGDPQEELRIVHIAGTNGKGAVGRMIAVCMQEAGYHVGHFATPDVFCYEDEFVIDGSRIAQKELAEVFTVVQKACEDMTTAGLPHPTRFEVETAAAFYWFHAHKVDLAVIEAGMGGAQDATNLVKKPLLCVLTAIGMDHMQFLGNTLAEIAGEKAGIIKPGAVVVTQAQEKEALAVLEKRCAENGNRLIIADAAKAEVLESTASCNRFRYQSADTAKAEVLESTASCNRFRDPDEYRISLGGRFQIDNAVTAIEALCVLAETFSGLSTNVIAAGLAKVTWPGRFERIGTAPDFFLDGAHNPPAAKRLAESIEQCFTGKTITYIMGVLADKSYETVIDTVLKRGDIVFTVTSRSPRALPGAELANVLNKRGMKAENCESMEEAVKRAIACAGEDGIVLAFGTLSHLGDLRKAYEAVKGYGNEAVKATETKQ